MKKVILKADKRTIIGRKVKKLREEGKLPANIYGKKMKSTSIQVDTKEFEKVYKQAGETTIVEISLEAKKHPVLIQNVQLHPVSDKPLHIDFYQVNLKEKIQAVIPLELKGDSPAVKSGIGTVVLLLQEVEVEALPTDLPEKYTIDISKLVDVDDSITVKALSKSAKVSILNEPDQLIVKVEAIQEEEVPEPTPAEEEPAEGEAATESEEETPGKPETKEEQPAQDNKEEKEA